MRIEAVITCVNYSDFLAYTLPTNRSLFDRTVVVTTPEDRATRTLCEFWNVSCVATSAFTDRGVFCKGAGINAGLAELRRDGWLVHMDADILLPPLFRDLFQRAMLDPAFLYGVDRMMVKSYEDWAKFLAAPPVQQEADIFVHPQPFPIGVRIATSRHGGYLPIGYFQMWHGPTSGILSYPDEHGDAGRGDMLFAANWPRSRRGMFAEVIAYHLESASAPMGANWSGRTTPPFGLPPSPESTLTQLDALRPVAVEPESLPYQPEPLRPSPSRPAKARLKPAEIAFGLAAAAGMAYLLIG
jgi:hypothetical protein